MEPQPAPAPETETITYNRKKQRGTDCVTDSGLRFDDSVPRKTIRCSAPELERTLRVLPMGRKSWQFCWTEIGAERVDIIQNLLTTCWLHDIHPTTYLVDVLQRVRNHAADQMHQLTPRLWKTLYADNPLHSDL